MPAHGDEGEEADGEGGGLQLERDTWAIETTLLDSINSLKQEHLYDEGLISWIREGY